MSAMPGFAELLGFFSGLWLGILFYLRSLRLFLGLLLNFIEHFLELLCRGCTTRFFLGVFRPGCKDI